VRTGTFLAIAALALTSCAGSVDPQPTALPGTPVATVSGQSCPPAKKLTNDGWPADVPAFVPRPNGIKVQRTDRTQGNVTQIRSTVPMSLRESLLWVVREFPKAGFSLGRGDAEATEVDAPFQRGEALRGLVRVFITQNDCETLWLYAVVRNTNAPYDIGYTPPPSSTPLPFG
jgi:hypothetical protein